jgi:asparagine synthase (glutamine-hydrolysing)
MSYRYLALIDADHQRKAESSEMAAKLLGHGMRECFSNGSLRVFVDHNTPFVILPGSGIAIGHLFPGEAVADGPEIDLAEDFRFAKRLRTGNIEGMWGEYVMFQAENAADPSVAVTRDPSGGVPCIYSLRDGQGFITSSVSLAARLGLYSRQIDWEVIAHLLTYPNLKSSRTALGGILELLPGTTLRVERARMLTDSAWSPWTFVAPRQRHTNLSDAAADIRRTVSEVVRTWANVDASILMELSGGLDSSVVAACLGGTPSKVVCCNVVTPVPGGDERHYAVQIAHLLGVELHSWHLDPDIACADIVPHADATTPRTGILQHAVAEVMQAAGRLHGASSFYLGAGGDTVFGLLTNAVPAADAIRELGLLKGAATISDLSALHQCTIWKAAKLTLRKVLHAPKPPCPPNRTFLNPAMGPVAVDDHPWFDVPEGAFHGDRERIFDLASNHLFRDMVYRGDDGWVRMPLLSQPVMEACLRVPTWLSVHGGHNRAVARAAFADVLPPDILGRRSKGTFVGYLGALFRRNRKQIHDTLLSGALHAQGLIDPKAVTRFCTAELPPRDESFLRLLTFVMVENWVRRQG